jgi:CRISPR-associated protein Cas2
MTETKLASDIRTARSSPDVAGRPRFVWLLVFYDLPVAHREDRKTYARFHKSILKRGYEMMQFSVYRKFVGTADRGERELAKLVGLCPNKGHVSVMSVTEKQMGRMTTIWNGGKQKENSRPTQMVLF